MTACSAPMSRGMGAYLLIRRPTLDRLWYCVPW